MNASTPKKVLRAKAAHDLRKRSSAVPCEAINKWLTEARRLAVLYWMASDDDKPRRLADWRRHMARRV